MLSAVLAGSTMFSAVTFVRAEESVDLNDGLKNYWNFENVEAGATSVPSNDGKGVEAELIGNSVSIVDSEGTFGNVLHFGRENGSYMKVSDYINTSGNTSFSMWYRYDPTLDDRPSSAAVLLQQDGNGRSLLTLRPSGQYHTYINGTDVLSDDPVAKGDWQNVTVTFDQGNKRVKFYINGVLDSEKPLGNNAVDALTALFVGAHKVPANNDPHAMKGDIDELRVYEKVLSDEEAMALYAEKGVELEKTAFADAVQEARELYDSGALSPSSPYAQALLETIEDGEAALAQEDLTLSELRAAAAALENAVNAYQALVPVVLSVQADDVERTIDSGSIFGINHRYAFNGYGTFDPQTMQVKDEFKALYEQVGFGSIRYPGGTISNLYNWKTALGPKETRKKQIHGFYNNPGQGGIEPNFGISEIATFADSVDSEIVYVYSLARGNAQDAADLVEYLNAEVGTNPNGGIDWAHVRAENGHPDPYHVRYFEIGNEMNQGGGDGTASQQYWTAYVSGGSENAYIQGGTASFTRQYAVCEEDWNQQASLSDGSANMVRYMRYANVNPKTLASNGTITDDERFTAVEEGSVHVYVGNEEWTIVDSLSTAGAQDKAVEIDHATGAIRFGDGVHGAIPASGTQISVSYQVEREGFLGISAAIKETTRQINEAEGTDYEANVYSSYETQSFITKMNDLGANALYDGMTIHPYSGTPQGSSDEAWYDDAMLKAENTGIARVQSYVNMLPEGKVPVISEYGIFRSTDTQVRSMTHALYIAKVMMEYVRLGSPYIQKHCLVDYYSSGADALGPTQQAVIQAVAQEGADTLTGEGDFAFFLTPSAFVFQMLNKGFGDEVLSASFSQQFTMPNGVTSLSSLVSRDQAGNLYFAIVNVDRTSDRRVKLDVSDTALAGKPMEIQLLNADSISAENTLEDPDNVQIETTETIVPEDQTVVIPAHSFAVIKVSAEEKTNTAPIISAEDRMLTADDPFDPLEGVSAYDVEDGEITLTEENVIFNDVNMEEAGTYHVTYQVKDSQGEVTELTITVTVREKETGEEAASDAAINALNNMVDKAIALGSEDAALNEAANAQAVLAKETPTAVEVVTALLDLSEAMANLNTGGSSDKLREDLKATIDYINAYVLTNVDNVRPAKVTELKTAVAEAYQVYMNEDATADEIRAAIRTLTEKAQELWLIVSKAELNALIESAEAINADGYTDLTYRALQAAITAAKSVAENDNATTSEVTTAITDLANAIAGLETIQLDTSALEHEIELVSEMIANIGNYVASTVEGLADKLDDAQNVLENAATQDEIDAATKTLREARLNARTKADTSALEELIAYINSLDLRAYTTESAQALIQELARAENLTNDPEITQEEVNDMFETLQASVDELVEVNNSTNAEESTNTAAMNMTNAMFALMLAAGAAAAAAYRRKKQ